MVEVTDINDEASFDEWIMERPQYELDAVVNRAALRVLPTFLYWFFVETEKDQSVTRPISVLWQSLFSYAISNCSSRKYPTPLPDIGYTTKQKEIKLSEPPGLWSVDPTEEAAQYSSSAAFVSRSLPIDISYPQLAIESAMDMDMWAYVQSDCKDLDKGILLNRKRLWGGSSNPLLGMWAITKAQLQEVEEDWSFWVRWYDSVLAGQPLSCDMLFEILRVPSEDWRKESTHVNGLIAAIEEEFLSKSTPQAERVELNPETSRFRVVPERMSQKALYSNILETIIDGMSDLRSNPAFDNALSAISPVFETILDRTFTKYSESPQRVHDDFIKARKRIQKLVDVGELSPNDEVLEFIEDLDRSAAHIRANMPQVRESMAALANLRLAEASEEQLEAIDAGVEAFADISEPELAEQIREDSMSLLNASRDIPAGAPPVQAPDEAARLASRMIAGKRILTSKNALEAAGGLGVGYRGAQIIAEAVRNLLQILGF